MRTLFLTLLLFTASEQEEVCNVIIDHYAPASSQELAALCIGAPELLRYNELDNLIETRALELLYVQRGPQLADFSIGNYQMKPSFIEKLEEEICSSAILEKKYGWVTDLGTLHEKEKRAMRLENIQQPEYQKAYLNAFFLWAVTAYQLDSLSLDDKIVFVASAYNLGFGYNKEEIISYSFKQYFPYGRNFKGQQYAYGQLAKIIYHQTNMLCNSDFPY